MMEDSLKIQADNHITRSPKNESYYLKVFIAACFFGLLWGGWAFFCNRSYGENVALRAFVTQFTFSFSFSFFFGISVESMYQRNKTLWGKFLFAFLLPVGVLVVLLAMLHYFRGTPNIFFTILPSSSFAGLYCIVKIAKGHASV